MIVYVFPAPVWPLIIQYLLSKDGGIDSLKDALDCFIHRMINLFLAISTFLSKVHMLNVAKLHVGSESWFVDRNSIILDMLIETSIAEIYSSGYYVSMKGRTLKMTFTLSLCFYF